MMLKLLVSTRWSMFVRMISIVVVHTPDGKQLSESRKPSRSRLSQVTHLHVSQQETATCLYVQTILRRRYRILALAEMRAFDLLNRPQRNRVFPSCQNKNKTYCNEQDSPIKCQDKKS